MMREGNAPRRMGVSIGGSSVPSLAAVPEELLQTPPGLSLNLEALDLHIRYWEGMALRAKDEIGRIKAYSILSGLQTARALHGLPWLDIELPERMEVATC